MDKYYTRACNFYFGKNSQEKIKKIQAQLSQKTTKKVDSKPAKKAEEKKPTDKKPAEKK